MAHARTQYPNAVLTPEGRRCVVGREATREQDHDA